MMRSVYLAATCCLLIADVARADETVLVDHVPGGAEPAVVVAVIKTALTNREWTITAVGVDFVDAKLDHAQNKAKIHVFFSEGRVLYEGSSLKRFQIGVQQPVFVERKGDIPERWVTYLRRDISSALATIPETRR